MTHFLDQKCQALDSRTEPMNEATIHSHLTQVSGWALHQGAIEKTFEFKNFYETIAFVNALAWICNIEDHHPELKVSYSRCVVRFDTHSVGGISINDFICAAKSDALIAFVG